MAVVTRVSHQPLIDVRGLARTTEIMTREGARTNLATPTPLVVLLNLLASVPSAHVTTKAPRTALIRWLLGQPRHCLFPSVNVCCEPTSYTLLCILGALAMSLSMASCRLMHRSDTLIFIAPLLCCCRFAFFGFPNSLLLNATLSHVQRQWPF